MLETEETAIQTDSTNQALLERAPLLQVKVVPFQLPSEIPGPSAPALISSAFPSPSDGQTQDNLSPKPLAENSSPGSIASKTLDAVVQSLLQSTVGDNIRASLQKLSASPLDFDGMEIRRSSLEENWGFASLRPFSEYLAEAAASARASAVTWVAPSQDSILRAFRPNMVLIVSVKSKKSFAVHVKVEHVCDRSDLVFRNVGDYDIVGVIEASDISEKASDGATSEFLRDLRVGDHLKAAIKEVDLSSGSLALTLRKSQVNLPLSMRQHRLGPIEPAQVPQETSQHRPARSFLEDLHKDSMFHNPSAVKKMVQAYCVDPYGSFSRHAENSGPFYDELRRQQNSSWAQDIVATGIQYAKREDYKTAMKYYSHALQVDPDNKDAHVARGACFFNINMLEDAEKEFLHALRIDPEDANASKYLLSTREKLSRHHRENEEAQYGSLVSSLGSVRAYTGRTNFTQTPQVALPTPPDASGREGATGAFRTISTDSQQALQMLGVTSTAEQLRELLHKKSKKRKREKEKEREKEKAKKRDKSSRKEKEKSKHKRSKRSDDQSSSDISRSRSPHSNLSSLHRGSQDT